MKFVKYLFRVLCNIHGIQKLFFILCTVSRSFLTTKLKLQCFCKIIKISICVIPTNYICL